MDDFGVKYTSNNDANHLNTLKLYCDVSMVDKGKEYIKIDLDWDDENNKLHLLMNSFHKKVFRYFNNFIPSTTLYPLRTKTVCIHTYHQTMGPDTDG